MPGLRKRQAQRLRKEDGIEGAGVPSEEEVALVRAALCVWVVLLHVHILDQERLVLMELWACGVSRLAGVGLKCMHLSAEDTWMCIKSIIHPEASAQYHV
jgi:hypothetical protein